MRTTNRVVIWSVIDGDDASIHQLDCDNNTSILISLKNLLSDLNGTWQSKDLLPALSDLILTKKWEVPSYVVCKTLDQVHGRDVKLPIVFQTLYDFLDIWKKTISVECITVPYHQLLTFSAYYQNPLKEGAVVYSVGERVDGSYMAMSQFKNDKCVHSVNIRWKGTPTAVLGWIGHSSKHSILPDYEGFDEKIFKSYESKVSNLASLYKGDTTTEEFKSRWKNIRKMAHAIPDYTQWKRNNFFAQGSPIEDLVNTDKKRFTVYEDCNDEYERASIALKGCRTYLWTVIASETSVPLLKECDNNLIITGFGSRNMRMWESCINDHKKPIYFCQDPENITHGMSAWKAEQLGFTPSGKSTNIKSYYLNRKEPSIEPKESKRAHIEEILSEGKTIAWISDTLSLIIGNSEIEGMADKLLAQGGKESYEKCSVIVREDVAPSKFVWTNTFARSKNNVRHCGRIKRNDKEYAHLGNDWFELLLLNQDEHFSLCRASSKFKGLYAVPFEELYTTLDEAYEIKQKRGIDYLICLNTNEQTSGRLYE